MNIKCPCCRAQYSLDAALAVEIEDESTVNAVVSALKLSQVGRLVLVYLGLFRPDDKKLAWKKVEKLLAELQPQIEAETIRRNGVAHTAPLFAWENALRLVIEMRDQQKLTLPFKTHGYLYEVVLSEAAKSQAMPESAAIQIMPRQAPPKTKPTYQSAQNRAIEEALNPDTW